MRNGEKLQQLAIGDKLQTTNTAATLTGEEGIFLVWGPAGQVEQYECVLDRSVISINFLEKRAPRGNYLIEKLANRGADRESGSRARAATA